jgi:hypothetical protein
MWVPHPHDGSIVVRLGIREANAFYRTSINSVISTEAHSARSGEIPHFLRLT